MSTLLDALRHLAWYVSWQMGDRVDRD